MTYLTIYSEVVTVCTTYLKVVFGMILTINSIYLSKLH
jgi:hypothetical protein